MVDFHEMEEKEAKDFKPQVVYVDEKNNIIDEIDHVKKDDEC